ncbi:hypothetical protein [Vibrio vulnificus]|nr:hypothetical protein [Vibrio vulnificus]
MKNEAKATRSDNEQADLNDSDVALDGIINLLDYGISTNTGKVI